MPWTPQTLLQPRTLRRFPKSVPISSAPTPPTHRPPLLLSLLGGRHWATAGLVPTPPAVGDTLRDKEGAAHVVQRKKLVAKTVLVDEHHAIYM